MRETNSGQAAFDATSFKQQNEKWMQQQGSQAAEHTANHRDAQAAQGKLAVQSPAKPMWQECIDMAEDFQSQVTEISHERGEYAGASAALTLQRLLTDSCGADVGRVFQEANQGLLFRTTEGNGTQQGGSTNAMQVKQAEADLQTWAKKERSIDQARAHEDVARVRQQDGDVWAAQSVKAKAETIARFDGKQAADEFLSAYKGLLSSTAQQVQAQDVQTAHNVIQNITESHGKFVAAQAVYQQKAKLAADYGPEVGQRFENAHAELLRSMGYATTQAPAKTQMVQPASRFWEDAEKVAYLIFVFGTPVFVAVLAAAAVIAVVKRLTR